MSTTGNTNEPKMLVCGKHERVPAIPGARKRKTTRPLRAFVPGEKQKSCICDYTEFPKLLKERLDDRAREEKQPHTGKPFRLMDLPAELRLHIYEDALCLPGGIEFCPEPWYFDGKAPPGRVGRELFDQEWRPVTDHHEARNSSLSKAARLLRTSKQIYQEAKPVFYGENEWRFTNTSGWVGLDRFFYQIGLENCKLLRNITVCHPSFTILPESLNGDNHFWRSLVGIRLPLDPSEEKGIYYPNRWFEGGLPIDPFLVLEKITHLRNLNILLPPIPQELDAEIVDESKFDNLTVTLISVSDTAILDDGHTMADDLAEAHNADITPGLKRWMVGKAVHDTVGCYDLVRRLEEGADAEEDAQ